MRKVAWLGLLLVTLPAALLQPRATMVVATLAAGLYLAGPKRAAVVVLLIGSAASLLGVRIDELPPAAG